MTLNQRSYEPELLDAGAIPVKDLYKNLLELNTINTLLGGHAVTLKGLRSFSFEQGQTYMVLDIGCGGGDNLRYLAAWARENKLSFNFLGVDLKKDCINFAENHCKNYPEIRFRSCDYKDLLDEEQQFDIIFTALFCHHFKKEDLDVLFMFQKQKARLGFFMNDLHRHPLAYYSIALLTTLFSRSYLVKNDAKLSVARGFKRPEIINLMRNFDNGNFTLRWVWAFRWLLIYKNN